MTPFLQWTHDLVDYSSGVVIVYQSSEGNYGARKSGYWEQKDENLL